MQLSPQMLKSMGLRFTRSIIDKGNLKPENRLWRSVLMNALEDAFVKHSDRKNSLQKISAHNWFVQMSRDFQIICGHGLLDYEDMHDCYINALKTRNIVFTERQVAWHSYDKIYKKILICDSKWKKKRLRKDLEKKRVEVFSTAETILPEVILSAFV